MNIVDRVNRIFPDVGIAELAKWTDSGRDYAGSLDKLPAGEREAVAQLFACYGLARCTDDKRIYRRGIDAVIAPWYRGARP